jgi:hypothetical protein
MQQRRGTSTEWNSDAIKNTVILAAGEMGLETNTGKFKIGNGTSTWAQLDYFKYASEATQDAVDIIQQGVSSTFDDLEKVETVLVPLNGGTSAQVLTKKTGTGYDYEWRDIPLVGIDALTDVEITSPSSNDVLQYIGGKWVNNPIAVNLFVQSTTPTGGEDGDLWLW